MAVQSSVFSLISEVADPMLQALPEDGSMELSPLIELINVEKVPSFAQPEAGKLDIWATKSAPRIVIGDKWMYANGSRGFSKGQIRFKKITAEVEVGEDAVDRIRNNADPSILESQIKTQKQDIGQYLMERIESMAIRDLNNSDDDSARDTKFKGLFASSSTGTLSDPADMNATAGTPSAQGALNLSGTNQTANVIPAILTALLPNLVKKDGLTKARKIPYRKIYAGMTSEVESVLKSTKDILYSDTAARRSEDYQYQMLVNAGITPFVSEYFDYDYSYATTENTSVCFFMDPQADFKMMYVEPNGGSTWDPDWNEVWNHEGELKWKTYNKTKKMEIGFVPRSYGLRSSTGAYTYYKKVFWMTLTPYEDS